MYISVLCKIDIHHVGRTVNIKIMTVFLLQVVIGSSVDSAHATDGYVGLASLCEFVLTGLCQASSSHASQLKKYKQFVLT